jgi:hypothetical protein
MRAHNHRHAPRLAAPEAAASLGAAGSASVVAAAVAPAGLNAQKESALAARAAQSREQNELSNPATGASADKAFFTLRALLALKGYSLHRTAAGDGPVCFYVTRWGMARELRDLPAVVRLLDQVGGAA